MYMDDIKGFAKKGKLLETLIQRIRIYSQDIGMEFGIEKCPMLMMKNRKKETSKVSEDMEKTFFKYLGILEADTIKQRWK